MRPHSVDRTFRRSTLGQALLLALAVHGPVAHAQTSADTPERVEIVGNRTQAERDREKQHSAPHQAITQGSLVATQPQSVINQHVIANTAAPTANYTDVIAISPSVVSVDPNGPGMMETQGGPTIRGFQDGQYNVTFDGIPWGDSNDFTHHSTSYFMPQDLGQIVVDRGPGDATNIGTATFGGTVAVQSKDPLADPVTTLYGSVGSFGTRLLGAEFDTGTLKDYGGLRAFVDYRQAKTDGYLTGAGLRRENLFLKAVRPIGDDSTLSFVAMKNVLTQHYSFGATSYPYVAVQADGQPVTGSLPGQVQEFGANYGLSSDPQSQAYSGYNYDEISTDMEYVGLKTRLGGAHVDNKFYTYGYYHRGYNGADPNGGNLNYGTGYGPAGSAGDGTFPDGAGSTNGTVAGVDNVPGQRMLNNYRSWGDTLRVMQDLGAGTLKYGVWIDDQANDRYQYEIDWTNGGGFNAADAAAATDRLMHDTLLSVQPYLAYAWKLGPRLTLTPGIKYAYFRRSIDAPVNQKTGLPLNYSQSWSKAVPSVDLHYMINPGWSAYAQLAKGFLAPNLNLFYVANPLVSRPGRDAGEHDQRPGRDDVDLSRADGLRRRLRDRLQQPGRVAHRRRRQGVLQPGRHALPWRRGRGDLVRRRRLQPVRQRGLQPGAADRDRPAAGRRAEDDRGAGRGLQRRPLVRVGGDQARRLALRRHPQRCVGQPGGHLRLLELQRHQPVAQLHGAGRRCGAGRHQGRRAGHQRLRQEGPLRAGCLHREQRAAVLHDPGTRPDARLLDPVLIAGPTCLTSR